MRNPRDPSLSAAPEEVYKTDRRSTVWRDGDLVIKQFDYNPLRQRLAKWLGIHPGQREVRANAALGRSGIPVVPIHSTKNVAVGLGFTFQIVTPYAGESLQRGLREGRLSDAAKRERVLTRTGELAAQLIRAGWFFRDLKTSNIILDPDDKPLLIDVGSARRSRRHAKVRQMLAMLVHTLRQDGLAEAEQRIWLDVVAEEFPEHKYEQLP